MSNVTRLPGVRRPGLSSSRPAALPLSTTGCTTVVSFPSSAARMAGRSRKACHASSSAKATSKIVPQLVRCQFQSAAPETMAFSTSRSPHASCHDPAL